MPATRKPGPVPQAAIDWLRSLNLDVPEDPQALWRKLYVRADRLSRQAQHDLLELVRTSLTGALQEGTTFRDWAAGLEERVQQAGWLGSGLLKPSRLDLIHTQNVRTSHAIGQWKRIEDTKDVLPYLLYELGPVVSRHRDEHLAFDGLVLPVDDPFWVEHLPPRGFRCKCRVRQISGYEAQRLGISKAPKLRLVKWKSADGRVIELPQGVEPGFEKHPAFEPGA